MVFNLCIDCNLQNTKVDFYWISRTLEWNGMKWNENRKKGFLQMAVSPSMNVVIVQQYKIKRGKAKYGLNRLTHPPYVVPFELTALKSNGPCMHFIILLEFEWKAEILIWLVLVWKEDKNNSFLMFGFVFFVFGGGGGGTFNGANTKDIETVHAENHIRKAMKSRSFIARVYCVNQFVNRVNVRSPYGTTRHRSIR